MLCPRCETDNPLGATYCAGCGARLVVTDVIAHKEAITELSHENWKKTFKAMNRALIILFLLLVAALAFHAYAAGPVVEHFGANAPLPPPSHIALATKFLRPEVLPLPPAPVAAPMQPDKQSEDEILATLAAAARDKLAVAVSLKTGGAVRGVLLLRTPEEVRVITDWGPPPRVVVVRASDINLAGSKLPE